MLVFPERLFARTLMIRGAWLWLGCSLMVAGGGAASAAMGGPKPHFGGGISVIAVPVSVAALGLLEAKWRNEDRFLMNMGVAPAMIAVLSFAPAMALEILLLVSGI